MPRSLENPLFTGRLDRYLFEPALDTPQNIFPFSKQLCYSMIQPNNPNGIQMSASRFANSLDLKCPPGWTVSRNQ
jgi:hypothetical protein